jgi:putative membrane protein
VKENLVIFICRWFLNTFALWFLISIFGQVGFSADAGTYFLARFIFAIVNSILRPILTILSIPVILLSYGLFTVVVNGVILWISMKIAPNVSMSLWNSVRRRWCKTHATPMQPGVRLHGCRRKPDMA